MKNKSLGKNAILNLVRVIFSLLFPLITFPYISRTVGPEGYGKVNYCISIVSYFTLIASFGVTDYASREGARLRDNTNKLARFCNQVFSINLVVTIFTSILYFLFILNSKSLANYKILLLVEGIQLIILPFTIEWFYTIFEDFSYITIRSIVLQLVSLGLLIFFVKRNSDYYKYALILVLSSSGGSVFNFIHSRKILKLHFTTQLEMRKHIKPMLILLGHSVALTVYVSSDITMLGLFCDDYDVGIYSAASKIYLIIKQLLNAITIVAVPRLSNYLGNKDVINYDNLLGKLIKYVFAFVCPCVVGVACLSNQIMSVIGGNEYIKAGQPLFILSFALFFAVFACLLTQGVLLPRKLEKYILSGSICSAIINLLLNLVAIPSFRYNGAAFTTLFAEIVMFVISFYYSKRYFKFEFGRDVISVICGCVAIFIVCLIINIFVTNILIAVILSVTISVVAYAFILVIFKHSIVKDGYDRLKTNLCK